MSDPTSPPSPGMPQSVLDVIKAPTTSWIDFHFRIAPPSETDTGHRWLRITQVAGAPQTWVLGLAGPHAHQITEATFNRLRTSTREADGSLRDAAGALWWLGGQLAVERAAGA